LPVTELIDDLFQIHFTRELKVYALEEMLHCCVCDFGILHVKKQRKRLPMLST
jgi:hypothetical protein